MEDRLLLELVEKAFLLGVELEVLSWRKPGNSRVCFEVG